MRTEKTTSKAGRRRITKTSTVPSNRTSAESLKRELEAWLDFRSVWNHDDWLKLLSDLRSKGYNDLIDTPKGRDAIGLYLETHKKN